MYHFAWANQREKQGYKCDVSLKGGIQIICTLEGDVTLYIGTTDPPIDCGFAFVNNIESLNLNFIVGCFLVGAGFLGHGGLGAWFLNDSISCPK